MNNEAIICKFCEQAYASFQLARAAVGSVDGAVAPDYRYSGHDVYLGKKLTA